MMALQLVLTDCADLLSVKQFTLHTIMCHSRIFDGQNNTASLHVVSCIHTHCTKSHTLRHTHTHTLYTLTHTHTHTLSVRTV